MTINWWTLGLQAVNVLILVWLLSRVFWRPVAAAIKARQDAAQKMLSDAKTTQTKADAALAEVTKTRAGIATERDALLSEAKTKADATAKSAMAKAAAKAETTLKAAQATQKHETATARVKVAADTAQLAVDIARKLLARLDTTEVQPLFLGLLIGSIDQMPAADKKGLLETAEGIDLISAVALDDAAQAKIAKAVAKALDGKPTLNFLTDPDLIAGFEIRTAHFVLHDSWKSDLATILKDLKNAA
jgi:F-type H+-transporting ATPase subunit b